MSYGFQLMGGSHDVNDGSAIKKKFTHCFWSHKNPFVIKDTPGEENDPNPYYGYTALPYISNESNSTYYDIRLCMLGNDDSVKEDNYLVTYYSSRYSYYPIAYWVRWDVILLIWSTRRIGMRRAVLRYNGGSSFTVIASAATIFSHTGSYDNSLWMQIQRDAHGALHILYPYRGSTAKLRYYYFNNDGVDGTEYESGHWATANFLLGKEWTSSTSPAFGGLATGPSSTFLNIINDTLIIGGISPQSGNIVNIKVTYKSLATAYNSWSSSWAIETATLPDETGGGSSKWRHFGPGMTVVVHGSNGSTFGDARYLMFGFGRIYYSSNYYCQFMVKFTLDSDGKPTAYDWTGGDLGFMLDSSSGVNTGPLINDGKSCRPMGLFPVYPAGFVHLYIDRASQQDTDGRTLQAVRWTFGSSADVNSTINSDPQRVHFDAAGLAGGNTDNSMLMIEADTSAKREVEHIIQDVANWGQFNQQHSEMHVSTPGTYVAQFDSHPRAGVYFADHGASALDTKSGTYYIGKQNKNWKWIAREQTDTTDKFLRSSDGFQEHHFTVSPGGGTESLDSEIFWPIDRETTFAARGACVLSNMDGDPTASLTFNNDASDPGGMDFTIDGIDSLRVSASAPSTTNHQMPAYIRVVAFIEGDEPPNDFFNKSIDPFGNQEYMGDVAGETGMIPLDFTGTRCRDSITWSVPSQEPMRIFAAFYDGRRMPVMMNVLKTTTGYRSGQYYQVFATSA